MAFVVSEQSGGQTSDLGHSGLTPIADNSGDAGWVQNFNQQYFPRVYTNNQFDSSGDAQRLQMMNQLKTLFTQYQGGGLNKQGYQDAVSAFPWINRLVWISGNWFNPTGGGAGGGTTPPPPAGGGGGGTTPPPPATTTGPPSGRAWNQQSNMPWKSDQMSLPPALAARLPSLPTGSTGFANERPEGYGTEQPMSWIEQLLKNQQTGNTDPMAKSTWE